MKKIFSIALFFCICFVSTCVADVLEEENCKKWVKAYIEALDDGNKYTEDNLGKKTQIKRGLTKTKIQDLLKYKSPCDVRKLIMGSLMGKN